MDDLAKARPSLRHRVRSGQIEGLGIEDPAQEAEIRRQLDRILASPSFEATARLRAFLAYVVGETLAGRGDRIKAVTIAQDVFGRDASFDAHSDPIVRVEASHLRRALEHYDLTSGTGDPVGIEIPKGG